MSIVDSSGSPGQAGVMAAIVLAAAVALSVLFLEEARKLLQKILSSKGERYA